MCCTRACSVPSQRRTRLGAGGVKSGGGGASGSALAVGIRAVIRTSEISTAATASLPVIVQVPAVPRAIHDSPMDVQARSVVIAAMRHSRYIFKGPCSTCMCTDAGVVILHVQCGADVWCVGGTLALSDSWEACTSR